MPTAEVRNPQLVRDPEVSRQPGPETPPIAPDGKSALRGWRVERIVTRESVSVQLPGGKWDEMTTLQHSPPNKLREKGRWRLCIDGAWCYVWNADVNLLTMFPVHMVRYAVPFPGNTHES